MKEAMAVCLYRCPTDWLALSSFAHHLRIAFSRNLEKEKAYGSNVFNTEQIYNIRKDRLLGVESSFISPSHLAQNSIFGARDVMSRRNLCPAMTIAATPR